MEPFRTRNGLTLIELAIVLIIIGLLAAGILVGRDLIEAAKVRAQVSQINELRSAVRTFRLKYNAMPGDILASEAKSYGMQTRSGAPGHGDGNGMIAGCTTDMRYHMYGCETALFWSDLSFANLVGGNFSAVTDSAIEVKDGEQDKYFLPAKIGANNYIVAYYNNESDAGTAGAKNGLYFALRVIHGTEPNGNYLSDDTGISPIEAYSLDTKIDDGKPNKGKLVAGNNVPSSMFDMYRLYVIPFVTINPIRCVTFHTDIVADMDANKPVYFLNPKDGKTHSCAINFAL